MAEAPRSRPAWFPLAALGMGALLGLGAAALLVLAYIEWKVSRGEEVDRRLRKLEVVQERHHDPEYRALMQAVGEESGGLFQTRWDFDDGIALSRALYAPTRMYGQPKYRYRPHTPVVNAVLWSGLHYQPIAMVGSPRVLSLLEKIENKQVTRFRTDAHGFKPTPATAQAIGPAIFVLGDSFTEGLWMDPEKTFANVLGELLHAEGIPARVYNLGVNGYSVLEMSWMLEHFAPELDPKVAILNLFPNDVHSDYRAVLQGRGAGEAEYAQMFRMLERVERFTSRQGIALVVSVIPAKEQFKALRGHAAFQDRLLAWCRRNAVRCIDPREAFGESRPGKLYISWDPHFSEAGHRRYAEFLLPHVRERAAQTPAR